MAVDAVAAATVAMGSLFWSIVVFVGRVLFGRVLFGRVLFGRVASVVVVAFAAAAIAMGIFLSKMDRGVFTNSSHCAFSCFVSKFSK